MMWNTPHGSRTCLCASLQIHGHRWWAVDWSSVPSQFLALFLSVCLSFTLLFSSHFYVYSVLNLFFHVDNAKAKKNLRLRQSRSLVPWPNSLLPQVMSQAPRRLPLLEDYWNHLPGRIRRQGHGALVLGWRGTRRWDHRESLTSAWTVRTAKTHDVGVHSRYWWIAKLHQTSKDGDPILGPAAAKGKSRGKGKGNSGSCVKRTTQCHCSRGESKQTNKKKLAYMTKRSGQEVKVTLCICAETAGWPTHGLTDVS